MGFLKDAVEGEGPEEDEDNPIALEERYQRLFMKMARDFVHVDDFVSVIEAIMQIVDPDGNYNIEARENAGAMTMAAMYKDLIEEGRSGIMQKLDLIDLSED